MFYGNGTARLVRDSAWRDQGARRPARPRLASARHRRFWFGDVGDDFASDQREPLREPRARPCRLRRRRAQAAARTRNDPAMWRNHFTCDSSPRTARRTSSRCANGDRPRSRTAAACCRAGARRRSRDAGRRTIRPGRSNTRISRNSATSARADRPRTTIWINQRTLRRLGEGRATA